MVWDWLKRRFRRQLGHLEVARALLDRGASPTPESQGHTPRSLAEAGGHTEIVTLLEEYGEGASCASTKKRSLAEIRFHIKTGEFGWLSNFAPYPISLDAKEWPTSEHYYQAQKFAETDPAHAEALRRTKRPRDARRMGRDPAHVPDPHWTERKDEVMRKALLAKFNQHVELGAKLLSTGDAKLIEHTAADSYWGDGGDGTGENKLGTLLMEVRAQLRRSAE